MTSGRDLVHDPAHVAPLGDDLPLVEDPDVVQRDLDPRRDVGDIARRAMWAGGLDRKGARRDRADPLGVDAESPRLERRTEAPEHEGAGAVRIEIGGRAPGLLVEREQVPVASLVERPCVEQAHRLALGEELDGGVLLDEVGGPHPDVAAREAPEAPPAAPAVVGPRGERELADHEPEWSTRAGCEARRGDSLPAARTKLSR